MTGEYTVRIGTKVIARDLTWTQAVMIYEREKAAGKRVAIWNLDMRVLWTTG